MALEASTVLSGCGSNIAVNRAVDHVTHLVNYASEGVDEKLGKLSNEGRLIKTCLESIRAVTRSEEYYTDRSLVVDVRNSVYEAELEADFVTVQIQRQTQNGLDESEIEKLVCSLILVRQQLERLLVLVSPLPFPHPHKAKPMSQVNCWSPDAISVHVSNFFGRENDVQKLVSDIRASHPLSLTVISIVGITGIGKTSLAKAIFNHTFIQSFFSRRIWISIDPYSNLTTILRTIAENCQADCELRTNQELQLKIPTLLSTSCRVLIVLDGVTQETCSDWSTLRAILSERCCILVTTQSRFVALDMRSSTVYTLEPLPVHHSSSLLLDEAFSSALPVEQSQSAIMPFVTTIVEKCGGIPLLVKSLGHLLNSMGAANPYNWKQVVEGDLFELLKQDNNQLMGCLSMFYNTFPAHLKTYLPYFSFLPVDHVFEDYQMVKMWMADGLVSQQRNKDQEDLAFAHFNQLLLHSCFEEDHTQEGKKYKVNILVHILASYLSAGDGLRLCNDDDVTYGDDVHAVSLSSVSIPFVKGFKNVSSVLLWNKEGVQPVLDNNLFDNLRFVRVLCLSNCNLPFLPNSICNLTLLRYLDASHNPLTELPPQTCDLFKLQSLNLLNCQIHSLPVGMGKMLNLLHFLVDVREPLQRAFEIQHMKRLRQLVFCIIPPVQIGYLKDLSDIRDLRISMLENIRSCDDAKMAKMNDKKKLRRLELAWTKGRSQPSSHMQVLTGLESNPRLTELRIKYYQAPQFPLWVHNLSALVEINFEGIHVSLLGVLANFQSLKRLRISWIEELVTLDINVLGGQCFPKLEYLCLHRLKSLTRWDGVLGNDFSILNRFVIQECEQLTCLPELHHLTALSHIELRNCTSLQQFPHELPPSLRHLILKATPKVYNHCNTIEMKEHFKSMGVQVSNFQDVRA